MNLNTSKKDINYFLSVDDETLDFLEKDAEKFALEVNEAILRIKNSAFQIINILILGIGSSFLFLTQAKSFNYLAIGLLVFLVLWTCSAIYLGFFCLSTSKRYLIYAKPEDLYREGYKKIDEHYYLRLREYGYSGDMNTLSLIRRFRLNALSMTIDDLSSLNKKLAFRLDITLLITILSPVASIICSAIVFYCLS